MVRYSYVQLIRPTSGLTKSGKINGLGPNIFGLYNSLVLIMSCRNNGVLLYSNKG